MHFQLRSPLWYLAGATFILVAALAFSAWKVIEHRVWPTGRWSDAAYEVGETYVRNISRPGEQLTFSGLRLDPTATSHERRDGNYETTGWVEQVNLRGHVVRRNWLCVVRYDGGDRWSLIYIKVDRYTHGTYVPE